MTSGNAALVMWPENVRRTPSGASTCRQTTRACAGQTRAWWKGDGGARPSKSVAQSPSFTSVQGGRTESGILRDIFTRRAPHRGDELIRSACSTERTGGATARSSRGQSRNRAYEKRRRAPSAGGIISMTIYDLKPVSSMPCLDSSAAINFFGRASGVGILFLRRRERRRRHPPPPPRLREMWTRYGETPTCRAAIVIENCCRSRLSERAARSPHQGWQRMADSSS